MRIPTPPPCANLEMHHFKIEPCFIAITPYLVKQMEFGKHHDRYDYHIGPQDILSIAVWEHPEFNYQTEASPSSQGRGSEEVTPTLSAAGYLVDAHGEITLPILGKIFVAGKTANAVCANLKNKLRRYVPHPQVTVRIAAFRNKKVYVIGEVNKPGMQPINDLPLTITDAIHLAGGLDIYNADPGHIYVIRGNILKPSVYWLNAQSPDAMILAAHFELKNRDILFISTANLARWNRAISLILPSLQPVWLTKTFVNGN